MQIQYRTAPMTAIGVAAVIFADLAASSALGDVVSLTLNPTSVVGTDQSTGTATLDAGFGRLRVVDLTSSNPAVASVPASVTTTRLSQTVVNFTITTFPAAVQTDVTITATEGGVSKQAVITVKPPTLTSITFSPNPLRGGDSATAAVTTNRPAPSNWFCSIEGPFPPIYFQSGSIVTFQAGASSTTKTVNSQAVANEVNALITVRPPTGQSPTVSSILSVVPTRAELITLVPSSVTGGVASLGCVTLNGAAPQGGVTVQLLSSDTSVAGVPPTLQIVQNDIDGCFIVQSHALSECASADISVTLGGQTVHATLSVGTTEQITDNAANDHWGSRHSTTSGGKVLWTNTNDVYFDDGTNTQLVQARGGLETVVDTVFGLGSGASAAQVIGAWRRGTDFAWVWRSGGQPVLVTALNPIDPQQAMNPEAVAIADGGVFMVWQAFFNANSVKHVFRVDPFTGVATNLTGDSAVPGVPRVTTSDGQAAWLFVDSPNPKLHFFDGSTITVADSGAINGYSLRLAHGRLVYEKVDQGVSHVFLYDSTLNVPTPVRLSTDTDAAHGNFAPATDGYHVAWLYADANGANANILLLGGLQLNDATSRPVAAAGNEFPLQFNRGQLLWRDVQSNLRYAAAGSIDALCVTPANAFNSPWLADGYVAGFGTVQGSTEVDNEVFIRGGASPDDADVPLPPFLLRSTPGNHSVTLEWDGILGASSYNIYLAEQSGVTKENFAALAGGRRIAEVFTRTADVCELPNDVTYYFVVTAIEGADEGGISVEVSATPSSGSPTDLVEFSRLLTCLSGPDSTDPPQGCAIDAYSAADLSCDGAVDLKDFAILSNFLLH